MAECSDYDNVNEGVCHSAARCSSASAGSAQVVAQLAAACASCAGGIKYAAPSAGTEAVVSSSTHKGLGSSHFTELLLYKHTWLTWGICVVQMLSVRSQLPRSGHVTHAAALPSAGTGQWRARWSRALCWMRSCCGKLQAPSHPPGAGASSPRGGQTCTTPSPATPQTSCARLPRHPRCQLLVHSMLCQAL